MALKTWPTGRIFRPSNCTMELRDNVRTSRSEETQRGEFADRMGERWVMTLEWPNQTNADREILSAKLAEGHGRVNTWAFYYFGKPIATDMAGTPNLVSAVPQGAEQFSVIGHTAGKQFFPGDWVSLAGQHLKITSCFVAGGTLVVTVSPRVRKLVGATTVLNYHYATGEYRLTTSGIAVPAEPGVCPPFQATFEERLGV